MTKAKISEYDAVASNNTDVNGVNIAEGCPPSGMNNMGREIMAALKRFQVGSDGDGVTVGGNLVVSGTSTLSTTSISSADINAGTIDATAIGGSTPAAGSFTTLNTSGAVVFNDAGADVDFRVESDTVENALFVEGSSGNVGIGTSSPAARLNIASTGNGYRALVDDTTNDNTLGVYSDSTNIRHVSLNNARGSYKSYGIQSNGIIFSATNGSESARITSGGQLLIGTTSDWFGRALVVERTADAIAAINNSVSDYPISVLNQATSGNNVFIAFWTEARGNPSQRGLIDYNRGAGLVRYNTTSDATLKNIIGDSDGQKSVEILNSTRIREFAWKDDETQKPQIGVIAQELYETYKGAVSVGGDVERQRDVTEEVEEEYTDEDGNTQTRTVTRVTGQETYTEYRPWGVDKTAFTFHLVAGWQAHEKIIQQQAEMIAALEARIAALEGQ